MLLGRFQSSVLMNKVCTQYRQLSNCFENDEACMYKLSFEHALYIHCTNYLHTRYEPGTYNLHTMYVQNMVKVHTVYNSVQNYAFCTYTVCAFDFDIKSMYRLVLTFASMTK